MKNIIKITLGLGLLLTFFTEIRFIPRIGIGELLILTSIILLLGRSFVQNKIVINRNESKMLIILFLYLFLLLFSSFINKFFNLVSVNFFDLIAISFSIALLIILILQIDSEVLIKGGLKVFYVSAALYFLFLFVMIITNRPAFYGIDLIYMNLRLKGFSENPNQISLLILFVFNISILLIFKTKKYIINVIVLILSIYLGLKTYSDALLISFSCSIFFFVLYSINKSLKMPIKLKIGSYFLLLTSFIIFAYNYILKAISKLLYYYNELDNQANDRLTLWKNGILAITKSPIIGNGSGSHSGLREPFEGFEAHNSLIDYLSATGLLGFVLLIYIFFHIMFIREKNYLILIFVCSVFVFSLFHNILRQPVFWLLILIVFCYQEIMKEKKGMK